MTLAGRYVAVVGPADGARGTDLDRADAVGELLAGQGAVVLTGGHHGVMRAAADGVRRGGGVSIGLLPGLDRAAGAAEHTFLLPTGLGELRNGLLVRAADAVVAVGCSWGTLSEIALARRTGVPLVLVVSVGAPRGRRRGGRRRGGGRGGDRRSPRRRLTTDPRRDAISRMDTDIRDEIERSFGDGPPLEDGRRVVELGHRALRRRRVAEGASMLVVAAVAVTGAVLLAGGSPERAAPPVGEPSATAAPTRAVEPDTLSLQPYDVVTGTSCRARSRASTTTASSTSVRASTWCGSSRIPSTWSRRSTPSR